MPEYYTIESDTITFPTPEKDGYDFDGWNMPSIETGTTGPLTIITSWTPHLYTIKYELDGGENSSENPTSYTVEDRDVYFSVPTKLGYDFYGWEDESGDETWYLDYGTKGDITLRATWGLHTYHIYYQGLEDGTNAQENPSEFNYFSEEIVFADPERIGYTFSGWSIDKIVTGTYEDKYVIASWTARTDTGYSVKYYFEDVDGFYQYDETKDQKRTGTTDTYATYDKTFDHFTFNQSRTYDRKISGKGDTVVEVYFNRNEYTLTLTKNSDKGSINRYTNYEYTFKYESTISLEVNSTSQGYSFDGWFIGDTPISTETQYEYVFTGDAEIVATFSPRTDTEYTVICYFERVEGYSYDEQPLTRRGTTDTTVTFDETFEHFTLTEGSNNRITIAGNGSSRIELYYIRDRFTVNVSSENVKLSKTYVDQEFKYGQEVPAITAEYDGNIGVEWAGWFSDGTHTTDETVIPAFTVEGNVNLVAKCTKLPAYSNFIFESTKDTCKITGVIDKTVSEIVVPNAVTEIGGGAFKGCSDLIKITLPFAGCNITGKYGKYEYQYPFGYIFGRTEYDGASAVEQKYRHYTYDNQYNVSYSTETYYVPDALKSVVLTGGVILYHVFQNCAGIEEIILPDGLTTIEQEAFINCTSLKGIILPDSVNSDAYNNLMGAFKNCTSLKSVKLSSALTAIAADMFDGCSSLDSIELHEGITILYAYAFNGCPIKTLVVPNSVTEIYTGAFCGMYALEELTVPYFGTKIGYEAKACEFFGGSGEQFYIAEDYCAVPKSLKKITVLGGKIMYTAFKEFSSLEEVVIGKDVSYIGDSALSGCVNLKSLTVPFIGNRGGEASWQYPLGYIFGTTYYVSTVEIKQKNYNNGNTETKYYFPAQLESITVDSGLVDGVIYANAFKGIASLETLTFTGTFKNVLIGERETLTGLKEIIVGDGVQNISSLSNLSALEKVHLGAGITELPNFQMCKSLTEVNIPELVTEIPYNAFKSCYALKNIVIPENVTLVWAGAFANSGLESITLSSSVNYFDQKAFDSCTSLERVIYLGTVEDWMNITFKKAGESFHSSDIDYSANPLYNGAELIIGGETITSAEVKNLTEIKPYVFYNYSSLTELTLPESITKIGEYAFYGCSSLATVNYGGTVDTWVNIDFSSTNSNTFANPLSCGGALVIGGETVNTVNVSVATEIKAFAFCQYAYLTDVVIGESVKRIENNAFSNCPALVNVTVYADLEDMGSNVFFCSNNIAYTESNGVCYLGNQSNPYLWLVKVNNTNIASFQVKAETTGIFSYAFLSCGYLNSVSFAVESGWTAKNEELDLSDATDNAAKLKGAYTDLFIKRSAA